MPTCPAADAAREAARHRSGPQGGQFGVQPLAEAPLGPDGVDLSPAPQEPVFELPAAVFADRFAPSLWAGTWDDLDALADEYVEEPADEDEWEEAGAHFSWGGESGWTVEAIAESMTDEGQMRTPVEIHQADDGSWGVSDGHHRVVAALRTDTPVRFVAFGDQNDPALSLAAPRPQPVSRMGANPHGRPQVEVIDPHTGLVASTVGFTFDASSETVEVAIIATDPSHGGRGYASAGLAHLIDAYPGAVFDTDDFASPWARRLWEAQMEAARARGHFPIDATFDDERCDRCRSRFDDAEIDEGLDVCARCSETMDAHYDGDHVESAPVNCWDCPR